MMCYRDCPVEKKTCGFWKFVRFLLIVAAISAVCYAVYVKFFKKKQAEDAETLPEGEDAPETLADASEAPAESGAEEA